MSGMSDISDGDMLAYIKVAAERSPLELARERAQEDQGSDKKVVPPLPPPEESPSENEEVHEKVEDEVGRWVQIEYASIAGFGIIYLYIYIHT